jgi:hypothetical protein
MNKTKNKYRNKKKKTYTKKGGNNQNNRLNLYITYVNIQNDYNKILDKFTELFTFKYLKSLLKKDLIVLLIDFFHFFINKMNKNLPNNTINTIDNDKTIYFIELLIKQKIEEDVNKFKSRNFLKDILKIYSNFLINKTNFDLSKQLITVICKLNNNYNEGFGLEKLQEDIKNGIEDFKQNSPNLKRNTNINIKLLKQSLQNKNKPDIDDYIITTNKNGHTYTDNIINVENTLNDIVNNNNQETIYEKNIEISRSVTK